MQRKLHMTMYLDVTRGLHMYLLVDAVPLAVRQVHDVSAPVLVVIDDSNGEHGTVLGDLLEEQVDLRWKPLVFAPRLTKIRLKSNPVINNINCCVCGIMQSRSAHIDEQAWDFSSKGK